MAEIQLFHNPRCSKSRGALALLEERGADVEVVRYLETPPDAAVLRAIVDAIDDPPRALVRVSDPGFRELGLDAAGLDDPQAVVELLVAHPELMERPVVVRGDAAVVARPPERLLDLLDDVEAPEEER